MLCPFLPSPASSYCAVFAIRMEGFGSADVTTPFNYGSVADGIRHNPSLEQKLKKKYWKTKQTVIQKLHKSQDEFVVAGDADIDTKLEVHSHRVTHTHLLISTSSFPLSSLISCAGGLSPAVILPPAPSSSGEVLFQTER